MTYRSRFSDINLDGWLRLAFAFGVMMAEIVARGILFFVPNYLLRGLESLISLMLPKRNRGEISAWQTGPSAWQTDAKRHERHGQREIGAGGEK